MCRVRLAKRWRENPEHDDFGIRSQKNAQMGGPASCGPRQVPRLAEIPSFV
jgi:hypothetical protein